MKRKCFTKIFSNYDDCNLSLAATASCGKKEADSRSLGDCRNYIS